MSLVSDFMRTLIHSSPAIVVLLGVFKDFEEAFAELILILNFFNFLFAKHDQSCKCALFRKPYA